MTYAPQPFDTFGLGLNLRDKTDAVRPGEAIDALNVLFTETGAVRQRDGSAKFTASALTNRVDSLEPFYTSSGTKQLLCGCGSRLEALNTSGSVVASATGLTASKIWDFARFGAPGSEVAYAGNGNDTLRKWDGSAWSAPAGAPKAGALAVMAVDQGNRLVASRFETTDGGPGGGTSNPSRVYFSEPGAPETWTSSNFVDLTPGDGEAIKAVVAWREFVIVFKETKFFAFYGTTTSAAGTPLFNYRTIDAGKGLVSPRAVAVAPEGVYFLDRTGVYRTGGGEPELVSSAIAPIFDGSASVFFLGGVLNHAQISNCAMGYHGRRLYLSYPVGSTIDRTLVYDPQYDWWTLYDLPASCFASFRISSQAELVFGWASGTNDVIRHASNYTNDAGVAISSRWRSGWFDYGDPSVKTIRESKGWGSGKFQIATSVDFQSGTGTLVNVDATDPTATQWGGSTWGGGSWDTPHGLNPFMVRRAVRGTVFSTSFVNSTLDQSWSVNRFAHHLREVRVPSVVHA